MTITIDGKTVTRAARTTWHPDDDPRARQTVVIGRAVVEIDGRDKIDALLLASANPRDLGARFVAFFEPWSSRFVLVEMP